MEDGAAAAPRGPVWAVDPGEPGPSLPPVGRSLFDQLVSEPGTGGGEAVYRVPFPFAELVRRVEEELAQGAAEVPRPGAAEEPAPAPAPPLRRVLIPFSRSLQRNAARPEFFRYPRALLAVDGEGGSLAGSPAGPAATPGWVGLPDSAGRPHLLNRLLKDRLFLGYQEKAGVLEVISYNEEAGRFEFQVVRDYRPGAEPQVVYAPRALCTTCHQNAAPIFSRQLWDETNANPRIARELRRAGRDAARDVYGFPLEVGVEVPFAFQSSADRANLLAAYQLLWREGCAGAGEPATPSGSPAHAATPPRLSPSLASSLPSPPPSRAPQDGGARERACRAALFTAVLQQALGGRFDAAAPAFRYRFTAPFEAAWRARWPGGLAVPDPDLPDRDPLAEEATGPLQLSLPQSLEATQAALLAELVRESHVPAPLEPLNLRPPLETWLPGPASVERLVAGLAGFLPGADLAALDRRLYALGRSAAAPRRRVGADCRFTLRRPAVGGQVDRLKFTCGPAAGNAAGGSAGAGRPAAAGRPAGGRAGGTAAEGRPAGAAGAGGLSVEGRVFLDGKRVAGGEVEGLALGGAEAMTDLAVVGGAVSARAGRWELRLDLRRKLSLLHARDPRGDAVEALTFSLPAPAAAAATSPPLALAPGQEPARRVPAAAGAPDGGAPEPGAPDAAGPGLPLRVPQPPAAAPAEEETTGRAELTLLADFPRAARAIDELASQATAGSASGSLSGRASGSASQASLGSPSETLFEAAPAPLFGAAPFRPSALIAALFARLGIASPPGAAAALSGLAHPSLGGPATPIPEGSAPTSVTAGQPAAAGRYAPAAAAAVAVFHRYCSTCHQTAEPAPPNFLSGDIGQVESNLAQCAERLYFRLSMWQLAGDHRPKTPMPPMTAFPALQLDPSAWPRHPDLLLLTSYAADLLRRQTGAPPSLADLANRGYESLRGCLPTAASRRR
jgi:cytochrome c5